jgi:hypothetical protein
VASVAECQAAAAANSSCFASLNATKVVVFVGNLTTTTAAAAAATAASAAGAAATNGLATGDVAPPQCFCQQAPVCTRAPSAGSSLFVRRRFVD